MARKPTGSIDEAAFTRRTLIVVAVAGGAFLLWQLRYVLVLLFAAVVIATVIRSLADPFRRRLRFPDAAAVMVAILIIVAIVAGTGWLIGSQIVVQTQILSDMLPDAIDRVDSWFAEFGVFHPLDNWLDGLRSSGGAIVSRVTGWLSAFGSGMTTFLLIAFGGIFLAAQPQFYRTGAIKLIPKEKRSLIAEAMDESEAALRLWLKGQLISMMLVGTLTGAGLWLLGIDSWLVLGLLAGLLEFVPFAGPILAAIPGVLLALAVGPELALWTLLLYVAVQQVESYLIQPLVQQYAVHIPPVVLLFSLLAFAMLFGIIGVLFAAPLAVVAYVLVKRLYVVEVLDTETPIPGDEKH